MKKDVILKILSSQQFVNCDVENVDLTTQASFYQKNGKYYISYDESEVTGLGNTKTTLKVDGNNATMIRTGEYAAQMKFIEHKKAVGLYETITGPMTISTYTSRVENNITQDGGTFSVEYTIELENSLVGEHAFEMIVTPQ